MSQRRFWLLPLIFLPLLLVGGSFYAARSQPSSSIHVYYLRPAGPAADRDAVYQALTLTDQLVLVDRLEEADVVVAHDERPPQPVIQAVREGRVGLVLFIGPRLDPQVPALADLGLTRGQGYPTEPRSLEPVPGVSDPLLEQIAWRSAPQVRARTPVAGPALEVLVRTADDGEAVLARTRAGAGVVYVFTPWPRADREQNRDLLEWPYWNYLVYHLAVRGAGATPLSYADYPASPVPHARERGLLVGLLAFLLVGTVGAYLLVRRYSLRHPEALDQLVADVGRYHKVESGDWGQIGFHRPLAGFLFLLAVGLVLFIILMIYQQVVLYGILLPSAQARGAWSLILSFFNTFWILFDWGTSVAFVKFFAEKRIDDPQEGIKYGQLYVWWQAITGTIQLGLVALVAAFVVPHTPNAFMSYYLIIHALIQFPGFLTVFQLVFRAFQKQDYDQALNLVIFLGPAILQSVAVYFLGWRWGASHPIFGSAMGGVFGLGVGAYLTQVAAFLIGYGLLRRLGYRARVLFLAHFDRQTVVSALKFGAPITIAGVAGGLGYTVQTILTAAFILNWAEVQGNWDVVSPNGLLLAYSAIAGLYLDMMPAISEAITHGRYRLTRYYIAQGFRYGGFFSAFIASALIGVGDRFILGALGPGYKRAAALMVVMGLWGMAQFPAWFSDRFQEGSGRPDLQMWLIIGEQALRILLMLLFVPRLQLMGLVLAYVIALPTKDVVAWLINGRLILPFRVPWWQTVVAPLLAGLLNYALLRSLGAFVEGAMGLNPVSGTLLFIVALLPSLPVYCFFNALLGGWDDDGLRELRRAARLSSLGKPLAWTLYYASAVGARLSPLHGRFPLDFYAEAQAEAASLTAERVSLV